MIVLHCPQYTAIRWETGYTCSSVCAHLATLRVFVFVPHHFIADHARRRPTGGKAPVTPAAGMRGSQTSANRCAQHKIKRTLAVVRDSPWERAGVRGGVGRGGWRGGGGAASRVGAGRVRDCRWRRFSHSPRPGHGAVAGTAAAISRQPFPFIWAPRGGRTRSFRVIFNVV